MASRQLKTFMQKHSTTQLPKLYSRNTDGTVQEWSIIVDGNKYATVHGKQNCLMVTSEWTIINEGKNLGKKNATTPDQQAYDEALSRWEKKVKSGGYWENVKDIDKIKFVEPMLAETYHKLSKKPDFKKDRWGMECKYNGNRCIATKHGLHTRKGEKYISVPHIEGALKEFFKSNETAELDGELFNNDLRQQLNEISKLIRKTKHVSNEDLAASEKLVKFFVYDGYNFKDGDNFLDEDAPHEERKNWIDKNVIPISKYFVKTDLEIVKSEEHMNELFLKLIEDQQEGGMLRKMNSPYEHKRSKFLLKVKTDESDEAIILDIKDGDGNWSGAATNVTLDWNGKVFDGVFKGKYELRAEILKHKHQWIGKKVTFLFMGKTGLGTPNFCRVDPLNCFSVDK